MHERLTHFREILRYVPRFRDRVLADALELVRMADEQHLVRVREAHLEFYDAWQPQTRPLVAAHREKVREILQSSAAVVIAVRTAELPGVAASVAAGGTVLAVTADPPPTAEAVGPQPALSEPRR